MKNIKIEMTLQELLLVATLLSDQLFRREFMDPKMPGYRGDPAELAMGKDLFLRLKAIAREASGADVAAAAGQAAGNLPPDPNGIPDAV